MLTKEQILEFNSKIEDLIQADRIEEAANLISEKWLIFCSLPEVLRDNRALALAAMSRSPQAGSYASERLKADLDLFIESFNRYWFIDPASFASVRDTAFILEYAKYYHYYRHAINGTVVSSKFGIPFGEAQKDIEIGQSLGAFCMGDTSWISGDKEADIRTLESRFPGFSPYVYRYAFGWVFGRKAMSMAADR